MTHPRERAEYLFRSRLDLIRQRALSAGAGAVREPDQNTSAKREPLTVVQEHMPCRAVLKSITFIVTTAWIITHHTTNSVRMPTIVDILKMLWIRKKYTTAKIHQTPTSICDFVLCFGVSLRIFNHRASGTFFIYMRL